MTGVRLLNLTLTIGVALALVLAAIAIVGRLNDIQDARERSAVDSCYFLRNLFTAATPPTKDALLRAYFARTALANCNAYGHRVREGQSITITVRHR